MQHIFYFSLWKFSKQTYGAVLTLNHTANTLLMWWPNDLVDFGSTSSFSSIHSKKVLPIHSHKGFTLVIITGFVFWVLAFWVLSWSQILICNFNISMQIWYNDFGNKLKMELTPLSFSSSSLHDILQKLWKMMAATLKWRIKIYNSIGYR